MHFSLTIIHISVLIFIITEIMTWIIILHFIPVRMYASFCLNKLYKLYVTYFVLSEMSSTLNVKECTARFHHQFQIYLEPAIENKIFDLLMDLSSRFIFDNFSATYLLFTTYFVGGDRGFLFSFST